LSAAGFVQLRDLVIHWHKAAAMQINLPPPSPAELARLEAEAGAHPTRYRVVLRTLTLVGDVVLMFVRVLPLAFVPIVGAVIINNSFFYWVAGIAVPFLVWLVRPGRRDDGNPISPKEMPELYAAVDRLKNEIDVEGQLQIELSDEPEASAREVLGVFGLFGNRRLMTLGIPLLAILGKDEARAVISHELGHFSRRHGRFGHSLYWVHLGWLAHVEHINEESTVIDRFGASFAHMFVPMFSRRAMVWSRRCEYEADEDAARAAGAKNIVSALARLLLFDDWQGRGLPRRVLEWQRTEREPPPNYLDRMVDAFILAIPSLVDDFIARESRRGSDWRDTHPPLAERAAALNLAITLADQGKLTGASLFGAHWPSVVAEYNSRWQKAHATEWTIAHMRHKLIDAPLVAVSDTEAAAWPVPQQLDRARALRRIDPQQGLAALTALAAAAPDDRAVAFGLAAAQLYDGDTTAADRLKVIAAADASYRVPVCTRLVRHFRRQGDYRAAEKWANQLETSGRELARAHDSVTSGICSGKAWPTRRPPPFSMTLFAALATAPSVAKAWLIAGNAPLATATSPRAAILHVDALVLVIDPFDKNQSPYDADAVSNHHQDMLSDLVEPNTLPVVVRFYSTEPLPSELAATLAKLPETSAYIRRE
jgi:Zn-dependent protease with chaperone function